MQEEILGRWRSPDLRVYAIWLPFRSGTRDAISDTVLGDPRVRHFWDGRAASSDFFGAHLPGGFPGLYDVYAVYGPTARWNDEPAPLAKSGGTVIGDTSTLMASVRSLLGPPS
ncbi:MAG: hypothetical protein ACRDHB_04715 [Actinomycetota bacterium]